MVQSVQKVVKIPRVAPIPEKDDMANFPRAVRSRYSRVKPAIIKPIITLKIKANVIFGGVKLAPSMHIKFLLPGSVAIK